MDVSPEIKLNQHLTLSYKSCAHHSSSPSDFTCDSDKKQATHLSHLPKEIPLKQLVSGSPHLLDRSLSDVKETEKDYSSQNTLITVYAVSITFAIGVTISLILHIYFLESLVFVKGMLVSDDDHCTALGQRVLHDRGSSVDAAIVAALCLAEAVSKVKDEQLSQRFRDTFFPDGQALRPGSFLRMPRLARVLEAGLSNFYDGVFTQEMEDELRANGGVLTRGDISNYSVQVEQPVEGLSNEFIIQVPPPPSAGAALLSALNLLQGIHLNENNNNTENQTHQWIAEALKPALVLASGLGDPKYNSLVTELLSDMLSKSKAEVFRQRTNSSTVHPLQTEVTAGQVVVMGPDDLIVSTARSASSAEFPEKHVLFLHEKDLKVQRVEMNSAVQGILKNKNAITAISPPQSSDLIVLLTT
ncbi:Glutathione hydrolase 7 [Larimichthys crocea]|uniref:Uncharacterized protein n=1 Tax=Larimichthys crocea TaxID=215358 RepID=A0ACD3RJB5_LARCR|nr:Glutathione hydrolase 7 [Larimichthys crocea]